VKYPDLLSAMRPVPHKEEFPVPEPPEILTFNDGKSDSVDHGQQEVDNVDCDPVFEASCSSFKVHLLIKGDIKGLVRDLNLFKNPAEPLGFRLKGGISSTKVLKCVSFAIAKMNSKKFLLRKRSVFLL
jgi:hypothetical protein